MWLLFQFCRIHYNKKGIKIVEKRQKFRLFIHKYTIFALEGIYLTNNNNKTNKQTKQKRKRNKKEKDRRKKERVLSRIRTRHLVKYYTSARQTIFKHLYSYLLREIFPSEDSDFSCVMIRGVGEDTLSPTLRDIEKERGEGQNCTRHRVVTPSLCGMLVQKRSAKG